MSRINLEDNKMYDPTIFMGLKFGQMVRKLAGAYVMDRDAPTLQVIDPDGVIRDIQLPLPERGLTFIFVHGGGVFDMTIKDSTAVTTYGTLSTTEMAIAISDGVRWYVGTMTTT